MTIIEVFEEEKSNWYVLRQTEQANLKKSARTQMQVDGSHCVGGIEVCEIAFSVECDFGEPGALIVESRSGEEFFLQSAELSSADSSELYQFPCNSWINQKSEENYKLVATKDQFRSHFLNEVIHRIFFTNKVRFCLCTEIYHNSANGLKKKFNGCCTPTSGSKSSISFFLLSLPPEGSSRL